MEIRFAEKEDLEQIITLFRETVLAISRNDYNSEQLSAWANRSDSKDLWLRRISEQYFILCYKGNDLVGFASLKDDDYVDLLFVHHKSQGKGIGKLLLNTLTDHVQSLGGKSIKSHVSKTAKPLFETLGYKVVSPNIVRIGEVELTNYLMKKEMIEN
ncbi:acetyltransferase [Leptospira kobayashii]|uniref:Acetyltransferase n=1 Tax=Leptospira kobayashii TaxID=1917830 RepID=A0ABN6KJ11_9LEPT|nr:GNAT family N-acetyltransferase [Leptospira kobayashii]BDA80589.1 acetyltransferase [Leptospira kobayashii]